MYHNKLMRPKEAARYLRISISTLARWRVEGQGPSFSKAGPRAVLYSQTSLDDWISNHTHSSTSSYSAQQ